MTIRERFQRVLTFERPIARLPMIEWAAWWDLTINRWKGEGMPPELDWEGSLHFFGLDPFMLLGGTAHALGLLDGIEHGHPVIRGEADYEALLPSLYPADSLAQAAQRAQAIRERHARGELITRLWLDGFFWWPRILLGIEGHLMAFYDCPDLMHRINRDLLAFNLRMLDAVCAVVTPDMVGIAEDMSYNHGPMLSRECFDEFLLPYYRQLIPAIKARGIKVLVDTDGMVEPMIPWILDAGFDGIYPLERQAGVDVARIRQEYPHLLMLGGYDKMVLTQGETAMRAEFERLLPVMRAGGYIPSVDHNTPPGVSLANYRLYIRLFGEYAAKVCQEPR